MDIAPWALNVKGPEVVTTSGSNCVLKDSRETPDTAEAISVLAGAQNIRQNRIELRKLCLALVTWLTLFPISESTAAAQQRPWQRLTVPSCQEAFRQFQSPPPEYGMVMWWWWNGPMTEAGIARDLRELKAHNVHAVVIWAAPGLEIEYLSPLWFQRVRFAVEQARALDLRVWLMDEGGYPSGFVGGKVSREFPELGMRVLSRGPDAGVKEELRSAPTRYVHSPDARKDRTHSLIDYLNPAATARFLAEVHERYREHLGAEFGRTVLGFVGDEPNYDGLPWTARLADQFQRRKGYDLRPHLPKLFDPASREEAGRIRADYYDVWTDLFHENFFRPQAEWCARHGLEYLMHCWGEPDMRLLIQHNGDYFKVNRAVQVPGVDAVWREIWPGVEAHFPKLASSAAHLFGRPRSFSESYAVYGAGLSIEQAKWVMDYQMVRGINLFQAMAYLSSNAEYRPYLAPPSWPGAPQWEYFPELAAYANRLGYLLSVGRPAAGIALYYPTTSGWLGDFEAERSMNRAASQLLCLQRDFDFIDEQGLSTVAAVREGALWNRSGQAYRAILIPPVAVLSQSALSRLEAFARQGGRVIFLGKEPALISGRSFLDARALSPGSLHRGGWARLEPSGEVSGQVIRWLPEPDLELRPAAPALRYLHRRLRDAEVFFLFNESGERVEASAWLQGRGAPDEWDPASGRIRAMPSTSEGTRVRLRLRLEPFETKLILLSPQVRAAPAPDPLPGATLLRLDGEWTLRLGEESFRTELKPWSALGRAAFWGTGRYRREFELPPSALAGGPLFLDLGEVRYAARVRLNGLDLGPRAWRPFRWDVTGRACAGRNLLEVEVASTRANELGADVARYAELERKGWLRNSMIGRYLKFDVEMVPSGLLGPVCLHGMAAPAPSAGR